MTLVTSPLDHPDARKLADQLDGELANIYGGGRAVMTNSEQAALFGRLSRAHGKDGDVYHADMCAERAFAFLDDADPAGDPPWIYWCNEADLSGMIGEGYVALGDVTKAGTYLGTAVQGLDASRPRDRVLWMISHASAQLNADQRDQAMTQARTAAAIAADLNSDRVVSYLGDFRAQLGSAARDAEIADFDDYLRATFPKRLHTALSMA